jgi:hypothetical protein
MTLHHISLSLDPFAAFHHLESLRKERPKDMSRYEFAQRRAEGTFAEFEQSEEARALEDGTRWTPLLLKTAYVHHGVVVDELTADILRAVAARFIVPNDISTLAHWIAVMHDELVAFFRFLDRKGFVHAANCICALENDILPRHNTMLKVASFAPMHVTAR